MDVALQLYTVRRELNNDFMNTLRKVSEIGYRAVEFAGFYGINGKDMKKALDDLNLRPVACHTALNEIKENFNEVVQYNIEIGNKTIICPYHSWKDKAECLSVAYELNDIGRRLKERGLSFGYHNHSHEFNLLDGEYGLDVLFNNTDASLVKMELDIGWAFAAGVDVLSYLDKWKDRLSLIHIKDMNINKVQVPIGEGIIDYKSIINKVKEIGLDDVIVESDDPKPDGLSEIVVSLNNLIKMNIL